MRYRKSSANAPVCEPMLVRRAATCVRVIVASLALLVWPGFALAAQHVDLLIRNGTVVDGSGMPGRPADVSVVRGRIHAVGDLGQLVSRRTVDATGLVVAPGFVDIHSHADRSVLIERKAESAVHQGWTTLVVGNCGSSQVPSAEFPDFLAYSRAFKLRPTSVNVLSFVGHGELRRRVLGDEARAASDAEIARMASMLDGLMRQGALGVSFALSGPPGMFADRRELVALSRVVARRRGLVGWHQRSESSAGWIASIQEALDVAEASGARLQLSHLTPYYPNWGRQREALALLESARSRGVDVATDVPPYLRGVDPITALLPMSLLGGGTAALPARLADPIARRSVHGFILREREAHRLPESSMLADGMADRIWIKKSDARPEFVGRTLAEIAVAAGVDPIDAAIDLAIADPAVVLQSQFRSEADVQDLLRYPLTAIGADETVYSPRSLSARVSPHPRAYGTAPLVFRKYVRGEAAEGMPGEQPQGVLTLEEAVRRMTSLPAARVGRSDLGRIERGARADLVLLDPRSIRDEATWATPHRIASGVQFVFVNGIAVIDGGAHTGATPGAMLRRE